MSLRVLLADESPSIKKAFSLALQDYGVKIQTVHHGVDVNEIAQTFKPDICFMDILLPKLNGYEACLQLKLEDDSKEIPVVLMWSGFMELDTEKFNSCKADASIEKPFETDTLRSTVKKLVARLKQNELSDHLILDTPLPDEGDNTPNIQQPFSDIEDTPVSMVSDLEETPDLPPLDSLNLSRLDEDSSSSDDADYSLDEMPAIPDFESILKEETNVDDDAFSAPEGLSLDGIDTSEADDDWMEQPIQDDFANLAPEGLEDVDSFKVQSLDDNSLPFEAPEEDLFTAPEGLELNLPPTPDKVSAPEPEEAAQPVEEVIEPLKTEEAAQVLPLKDEGEIKVSPEAIPQLSKEELKRLILAQSKDIIESVVWDVVPELAKEMIQKEIQRLTGEVKYESSIR
ncbi:MAG: response regulator [Bdellovibrionales bacterium]